VLWKDFTDSPELLIEVMLNHEQMFQLSHSTDAGEERLFLVPAMLPDTKDLVEDEHGELVRLNGLRAELNQIGECFEGGRRISSFGASSGISTVPVSEWPVSDRQPACYLVFGDAIAHSSQPGHGLIPEGLWFKLLVRCGRWAQQTDADWSRQNLAKSFRRDVARFSFGAQRFELRLYRAQHAIRLVVLGNSCKYPMGVLRRIRSLVDGVVAENFPALDYFIALRVQADSGIDFVDLDNAIREVERRNFATTDTFNNSILLDGSSSSGMVAVSADEIDFMTCIPWSPPMEPDAEFDVFLSHSDADADFAGQVYDCFAKFNPESGNRVRVFLRNVSQAHISRQITPETALRRSTIFVPIVSMKAISACGGTGTENIPLKALSPLEVAAEYFAVFLTLGSLVINLIYVFKHKDQTQSWDEVFLATVILPRAFNLAFVAQAVLNEKRGNPRFALWLYQNTQVFAIVALLACLKLDNLALLNSGGIGRKLFVVSPPISIAVLTRSRAFAFSSTVCGDLPQLVIAVLLFSRGGGWGVAATIAVFQMIVSIVSLVHQFILRGFAILLVSSPDIEQQWVDHITETEMILDCMLAEDFQHRRPKRGETKFMEAALPVVVDQECLSMFLSPDPVPTKVMEQFTEISGATAQAVPPTIGKLLSSMVSSREAIALWNGGGCAPADWNKCDVVARAVIQHLDRAV
jgi:hypothetical protein